MGYDHQRTLDPVDGLRLVGFPDERLTQPSAPVAEIDDEVRKLGLAMIRAMREWKGIGLAAPQVGVNLRLFVVETSASDGPRCGGPMVLVNPMVVRHSQVVVRSIEGCLSINAGRGSLVVPRWRKVVVEAFDLQGEQFALNTSGQLAMAVQHELDHLDGVTINRRDGK